MEIRRRSRVDSSVWGSKTDDPEFLVDLLEEISQDPFVRQLSSLSMAWLQLEPGDHVLDVGCGTGAMLPAFARAVGSAGKVQGIDHSSDFIREARQRIASAGLGDTVTANVADAGKLPFADASFDAAYCQRVLIHVESPATVLQEMRRVVRPGGWVVAAERDCTSIRTDHPDQETMRILTDYATSIFRNPGIGMEVRRLMTDAGLVNHHMEVLTEVDLKMRHSTWTSFYRTAQELADQGKLPLQSSLDALEWLRAQNNRNAYTRWDNFAVTAGQVPRLDDRQAERARED